MNHTTRRYPRTMLEAFGCDARTANPFESYRKPHYKRLYFWLLLLALLGLCLGAVAS